MLRRLSPSDFFQKLFELDFCLTSCRIETLTAYTLSPF